MGVLKVKLEILHKILACSEMQARVLRAAGEELDADGLMNLAATKEQLILQLSELKNENQAAAATADPVDERLGEEINQIMKQITELDTANIQKMQAEMENMRREMKNTRERIKVNTAYQTVLGRERNPSRRLDIKEGKNGKGL